MNANRPIPCAELAPLLSELVDGTLPREETMRVRAHLDGCAECRRLLADLHHLRADLDRLPRLDPPPALAGRVRAQARRDGLLGIRPASVGQRLLPTLAAAALIVLVIGVWPLLLESPAPPSPAGPAVGRSLTEARQAYQDAIARLEPQVNRQVRQLPPDARLSCKSDLALLDGIISDLEQILHQRNEDTRQWERLLEMYQQKVDFLGLILTLEAS